MEFAKLLSGKRNLRVVTNDLKIAPLLLDSCEDITLCLIRGVMHQALQLHGGQFRLKEPIRHLVVDKALWGQQPFRISAAP